MINICQKINKYLYDSLKYVYNSIIKAQEIYCDDVKGFKLYIRSI